jgi:hypothetical protein
MAKRLIDIEDLVAWGASELTRKRPGKAAPRAAFDVDRADRELVGRWTRPASFPAMHPMFAAGLGKPGGARGDPPHADALRLEEALARLAVSPPPVDIDELQLCAGLGFALDAAGAMRAALANVRNLLLVQGRLAIRPFLRLEPPTATPRLAANSKPGVWRREVWVEPTFGDYRQATREVEVAAPALRKNVYPAGAYCGLDYEPDPADLLHERAEYAAWHAGLLWLAAELAGGLESRAPLPPAAAARPWLGERDGEPVRDLFGPGAEGVHSGDQAATLEAQRRAGRRRPIGGARVYGYAPATPGKREREA